MIVTVTPNPSLDRTLEVDELRRGDVLRAQACRVEPAGKGINVARALDGHGIETLAVLPSGGSEGDQHIRLLTEAGIPHATVTIAGAIRVNISVVEPDGTVTKINEPGPTLVEAELDRLLVAATTGPNDPAWIVGSGSLAPGTSETFYADLTRRGHLVGARVAIDSSGGPLGAALVAGPDLVKPNLEELAEVAGLTLATIGDVVAAAQLVRERGAVSVLASLGAAGMLLVDQTGVLHASLPVTSPRSTVGAGDASLAGYLAVVATDPGERIAALRSGVAFGAAAVSLPGSQMPGHSDVHPKLAVLTDEPDPDLPLDTAAPAPAGT